jgi:hypothetical protein
VTAIDDARAALHAAHDHIGHGITVLRACYQGAEQIAKQAAQLGAPGIATNILGLRKQIEAVHYDLAAIDAKTEKVDQVLNGLDAHATPSDIAAALGVAHQQVNDMIAHAGQASTQVDALIAATKAALQGGKPEPMVAKLTEAKTHLATVAQQSRIAGDKAQQTQTAVSGLGDF